MKHPLSSKENEEMKAMKTIKKRKYSLDKMFGNPIQQIEQLLKGLHD